MHRLDKSSLQHYYSLKFLLFFPSTLNIKIRLELTQARQKKYVSQKKYSPIFIEFHSD